MKQYAKWLLAALLALAIVVLTIWFTGRETASMAEIERYANGPVLTMEADGGCVVLTPADSVPAKAELRYTLDGSDPTADSLLYTKPIPLSTDSDHVTVVNAAVFYGGERSRLCSKTFLPEGFSMPEDMVLVSLSTDPENLYNYETGILIDGKVKDDFIAAGGDYDALPIWERPANFAQRGDAWVRNARLELFDASGQAVGAKEIGLSVSGNASAHYDIKSFKLTSDWNDPEAEEFPAEWFGFDTGEKTDWPQPRSYKKISLKNGGQDRTYSFLVAPAVYPLIKQTGLIATPETAYAAVYLNGEFYSYMYIQQHLDRDYLADMYRVDKQYVEWMEGSEPSFLRQTTLPQLLEQDVNDPAVMAQIEQLVDMDNMLLFYAAEMAVNNRDSILNNYGVWRYTGEPIEGNPYTDGRYRFVLFDIDTAMRNGTEMYEAVFSEDGNLHSAILDALLRNPNYRDRFLRISMTLYGSSLRPESIAQNLQAERERQARWLQHPFLGTTLAQTLHDLTEKHFEVLRTTALTRQQSAKAALQQYLDAGSTYHLTVTVDQPGSYAALEEAKVTIEAPFTGELFCGSGLRLNAVPGPGRLFSHWLVNGQRVDGEVLALDAAFLSEQTAVEIEMVTQTCPDGVLVISEVSARGKFDWIEIQNVGGAPMDLTRLCITNKPNKPFQSRLPAIVLEPGETAVLSCKNSLSLTGYLVNFSLSRGEIIRLTAEDGSALDALTVPKLADGKTYGLDPISGAYVYFAAPTKGEPNR